jgi:uncharacterized membrane protein YphA (DoxX/SURF4 family)
MKGFQKIFYILLRILLGIIFIYASWDKILHPGDFAKIVENYRVLPRALVNIPAVFIPWVELLCGISLILGVFVGGSSLILSFLLVFFIFLLISAILRGIDTACGCFSTSPEASKVGIKRVIEDIVLLAFSLYVFIYWKAKKLSPE